MNAARRLALAPRAGDVRGGEPSIISGVDSIDVTAIGEELFGWNHGVFATTRSVLNDIKGRSDAQRCGSGGK
jgi:hypothetical protein